MRQEIVSKRRNVNGSPRQWLRHEAETLIHRVFGPQENSRSFGPEWWINGEIVHEEDP